ncbi:MAG: hypothetical protein WCD49_04115 [Candidatus Acidiferrales bacterium]
MAVLLYSPNAQGLLGDIKRLIAEGHIETWSYDRDGDFTHTSSGGQWKNKAWLRPKTFADRLEMNIIRPKDDHINREVFAIYHGRFIEMAIAHVPKLFSSASATPFATDGDLV